jgi:hypothetical protein
MTIPILVNQNQPKVIGRLTFESARVPQEGEQLVMYFELGSCVTEEILLRTIDCRFLVLDRYHADKISYLKKIRILDIYCREASLR